MSARTRRPHGDGSVFPYRDGFAAVLDLGWSEGKRRRKWLYGKTEAEVMAKFNAAKRIQQAGHSLLSKPWSLGDWLDEWLRLKERQGTRPLTLKSYRWLINDHIRPVLGSQRLDRLTPTMIRRLLEGKSDSGLSTGTVRHIHGLIRNALADAEREELVHRNVAKLVRPPALTRPERRALTFDEAKLLLVAIDEHPLEALWVCAVTLGLRRGELLGLRWVDVDFDSNIVAVKQTLQRIDGSLQLTPPKTAGSKRLIPASEPTMAHLRQHRLRQNERKLAAGTGWRESGLVFCSKVGTPMEPRNVDRSWQVLRESVGLDWLRLHDLRHALATFMIATGSDPRTVMKTLGHSQISLTMNTYAHVLPDVEREAIDRVARSLFG